MATTHRRSSPVDVLHVPEADGQRLRPVPPLQAVDTLHGARVLGQAGHAVHRVRGHGHQPALLQGADGGCHRLPPACGHRWLSPKPQPNPRGALIGCLRAQSLPSRGPPVPGASRLPSPPGPASRRSSAPTASLPHTSRLRAGRAAGQRQQAGAAGVPRARQPLRDPNQPRQRRSLHPQHVRATSASGRRKEAPHCTSGRQREVPHCTSGCCYNGARAHAFLKRSFHSSRKVRAPGGTG